MDDERLAKFRAMVDRGLPSINLYPEDLAWLLETIDTQYYTLLNIRRLVEREMYQ